MDCANCVYATTYEEPVTIWRDDGTIIYLNGKNNMFCNCEEVTTVNFYGDEMVCSGYKEKLQIEGM